MKIYTKKGDKGKTFLADGTRHKKNEEIFDVMGEIDELSSWIGLGISKIPRSQDPKKVISNSQFQIPKKLERIQRNLFSINSILAQAKNIKFDVDKETKHLENSIDAMEKELPELKNFILPGGHELSALFQIARVKCRRAERQMVFYPKFIPYINRLSDYFFVLARFVNLKMGGKEKIWKRI